MAVAYEENPLTVHCESCGGAANYDIVTQSYRCPYCGGTTSVKGAKAQAKGWRDARQVQFREHARDLAQATYTCPNCAAKVVVPEGEALAACSFCGGKPVRSEFLDDDSFPEVVIGFKITLDEARARLERWCEENARCKPETDGIRKNIGKLAGYYLPYQLVRGGISCTAHRIDSSRDYVCRGFANGIAVNTSQQMKNELLDAMEPFDWTECAPFDFGYVAGQRVKLQDLQKNRLEGRVKREVEQGYRPMVEKVMQSKAVSMNADISSMLIMPALLPAYVLHSKACDVAINGQTGKVAVLSQRIGRSMPWFVPPIIATAICGILAFAIAFLLAGTSDLANTASIAAGIAAVIAAIAFTAYSRNRGLEGEWNLLFTSNDAVIGRRGKTLVWSAGESRPDPDPVFFERIGGLEEPVRIRFYPPARIAKWVALIALWNTLPLLLGFLFAGFDTSGMWLGGIIVWLCISIPTTPAFIMKFFHMEVYDRPILYQVLPDGTTKRVKADGEKVNWREILNDAFEMKGLIAGLALIPLIISLVIAFGGSV